MKVGNSPDLAKAQAAATRQTAKAGASAPATETAARGATNAADDGAPVTLSSSVQAAARESVGSDFNAGKVAAVKAAIDNGSFRVNAEVVADKLLDNARETLSHVARQPNH